MKCYMPIHAPHGETVQDALDEMSGMKVGVTVIEMAEIEIKRTVYVLQNNGEVIREFASFAEATSERDEICARAERAYQRQKAEANWP